MNITTSRTVRYILSGGTGAVINIGTVYVLTHFFAVWYLISSVAAFIVSFFVSFYLQRTWTFKQNLPNTMVRHGTLYLAVALMNLALNTAIVYASVEYFGLWYVFAQILAGGIVALSSFFIYKHVVFAIPREKRI